MQIRAERTADHAAVRALNEAAFDSPAEAGLVDALRAQASPTISLVAEVDGEIAGHIMFSPMRLDGCGSLLLGLGPMAVRPHLQRRGIGSALVNQGLAECDRIGAGAVFVLGHPEYYPRFGFRPASRFGIGCEYDVPDEVFMALEIVAGCLDDADGVARYDPAFGEV